MEKSLKTEVIAGFTTFLTMSYIIIVNPSILSTEGTGLTFTGVLTATILISFLSSLFMGLFANLPFALAPGMGLNAFFTYTLILGEQIPWPQALGLVFWSGVFFLIISLTPLRVKIVKSIPKNIRYALSCGIGVFLIFIGFKSAKLIQAHPVTFVTHSPFSIEMGCVIIGLFISLYLLNKKSPWCFVVSISATTLLSIPFGRVSLPDHIFALPDFSSVFFKLDILGSLKWAFLPSILTLIVTDLFDSLSTFVGVSHSAGILDENGEPKNIGKALTIDAIATFTSSLFGTSAATTYIESAAGVEVGGRTGRTAMVAGLCFLPFLFLGPLLAAIPSFATAPVLILVGGLMFQNVKNIDFSSLELSLPPILIILLIPLTFSITQGILWGFFFHVLLYTLFGRKKELDPYMTGMGIISGLLLWLT